MFSVRCPNIRGGGEGVRWLGQNPNFCQFFLLGLMNSSHLNMHFLTFATFFKALLQELHTTHEVQFQN